MSSEAHQAHIGLSEPMTSIVQLGSSLGSCLTSPSPNSYHNPAFRSLTLCQVLSGGRKRQTSWGQASVPGLTFKSMSSKAYQVHIAQSEPMTSIVWWSLSLSSCPTSPSPNPHYNPAFRSLTLCQVLSGGRQRQISYVLMHPNMGTTGIEKVIVLQQIEQENLRKKVKFTVDLVSTEKIRFKIKVRNYFLFSLFISRWSMNLNGSHCHMVPHFYLWGFLDCCLHFYCYFLKVSAEYVLRPSSGVCQTQEPTRNFKLHPLLNPWGLPVLIPLAITGYNC